MVQLLNEISSPEDLHNLSEGELERRASEIRTFLIEQVSQTGGHLGPNLGVVELTLALHRVFDSPKDSIVWDTGHQSYVHKIVTGRRDMFATLRTKGDLSGYPSRAESAHDLVENSHASTALAYADGLSKAYALCGVGRFPELDVRLLRGNRRDRCGEPECHRHHGGHARSGRTG
ncbi:hypothetical protein GCM10009574_053790 [Streptomyces asiaticus]|uniref:1-deoxy-D-xylulose-5-phosphate synthase n=2 Tax=Streptomyces rhizosphaericus TaxID=114699 RepID=A0ABN1Q7R6_9ACTN